jgi:hypothetical protein
MSDSPVIELLVHAEQVKAHVTFHANYSPNAERHPAADWSVQVLWIDRPAPDAPSEPYSLYGSGASLDDACRVALTHQPPTGGQ